MCVIGLHDQLSATIILSNREYTFVCSQWLQSYELGSKYMCEQRTQILVSINRPMLT